MLIISLRLKRGAYPVYHQLKDEADLDEIKQALYTAFSMDESITWRQFIGQQLLPGETVDMYLANLRKLSIPFGGVKTKNWDLCFRKGCPLMLASSFEHHQSWMRWV